MFLKVFKLIFWPIKFIINLIIYMWDKISYIFVYLLSPFKFIINLPLINLMFANKCITLITISVILESNTSLFLAGIFMPQGVFLKYFLYAVISCYISDIFLFLLLSISEKYIHQKFEKYEKKPIMIKIKNMFINNYILTMLFYRFIPFSRFPILILSCLYIEKKKFFIFNLIGIIVWVLILLYSGYNKYINNLIYLIWNNIIFIFNKIMI